MQDHRTEAGRRVGQRFALAIGASLATLFAFFAAGSVQAQGAYPERQVRIVVPFGAGGSTDALARIVGQQLGQRLGHPFVIENRPGAAGSIGADLVAKAPADGYTLLMATSSTHAVLPHLRKLPYDAQVDFTPIAEIGTAPNVLIVSPGLGVSTVKELIGLEKARAGKLSYSSSGNGTITHLIGVAFAQRAGVQATHVPYKTGVQAVGDIATGQIDFAFDSIVWTIPQSRNGKVHALAVTSPKRSPLAPELPTVAESGFPGFEGTTWFGFMAPAGVDAAIVKRLNQEIARVLSDADVRRKFEAQGAEPGSGTSDQFARMVSEDFDKWGRVIAAGGIKLEN